MNLLDQIAASTERMKEFQRERLATEITELIARVMDDQGVSRAELASRLGKSRAYVTKMLRHGSNLTVHTIADVFAALGRTPRLVDRPLSVSSPRLVVMEIPHDSSKTPGSELEATGRRKKAKNQA
jgi:transcriptional regulator with XRE-family HTH domain